MTVELLLDGPIPVTATTELLAVNHEDGEVYPDVCCSDVDWVTVEVFDQRGVAVHKIVVGRVEIIVIWDAVMVLVWMVCVVDMDAPVGGIYGTGDTTTVVVPTANVVVNKGV